MKKVNYIIDQMFDIHEILTPVSHKESKPDWWNRITPFANKAKTLLDAWKNGSINNGTYTTTKICPGFINLFKRSYLLKFPVDLIVDIKENSYEWKIPVENSMPFYVSHHDPVQHGNANIFRNYHILKFNFPVYIQTKENVDMQFIDSLYWNEQPYKVAPGVINIKNKLALPLNVIVMFPKTENTYMFNRGDICSLVYFSDDIKLVENNTLIRYDRKDFVNGWKKTTNES